MGMIEVTRDSEKRWLPEGVRAATLALFCFWAVSLPVSVLAQSTDQAKSPAKTPPAVGTIKSINSTTIVLATDAGAETKVQLNPDVKYLRIPPDSKDLKAATPIRLSDLQVGDRILVRGKSGDDPGSFIASAVISMKKADLDQKKAHDQEEWQRHGIGGLVKKVDPATGNVTIGTMSAAGAKDVTVTLTKMTILRRYAPGSVRFDDATTSTIGEIQVGDQLRARGTKSEDGTSFNADEVVTGSFRNITGTVSSVDAGAGTMAVLDLATNKSVVVRVKPDTQLRKLPAPMAQMIAARLKGAANGGGTAPTAPASPSGANGASTPPAGVGPNTNRGGANGGGRGDLQALINRLPASALNDFVKGDAVLIVAAASTNDANPSAITVVGGVEPILQSSTQGQAASILTPWSLNNGGGGDAGTP
jgi:hypothetical protein